jgi:peptide-methionine (R)-S-oxide reductase
MPSYIKDAEVVANLSAGQFHVTQGNGTEPPGTGDLLDNKEAGIYVDIVSGEPLFASTDKYVLGCGWPSFTKPIDAVNVAERIDISHGMTRKKSAPRHSDSHLGHVFLDGPQYRGGLSFCTNSASLRFIHRDDMVAAGYGAYLDQLDGGYAVAAGLELAQACRMRPCEIRRRHGRGRGKRCFSPRRRSRLSTRSPKLPSFYPTQPEPHTGARQPMIQ